MEGWLYHPAHTHDRALRVDAIRKWSTLGGDCTRFPSATFGVSSPSGPGFATWTTPVATITETLSETRDGGCCGVLVEIELTNTDTVAHRFEWRVYHDTAFGPSPPGGACHDIGDVQPTVDGGPVEVGPLRFVDEMDLLALGATTCPGQVKMFSAETGLLRASYEMLPPHLPIVYEHVRWNEGAEPCTTWSGLVDGSIGAPPNDCSDNSLLLVWRFPDGTGTLAPGESATASYRIGWGCAWPCAGCESPALSAGSAADVGPCNDGILLEWDAATFPGAGSGVYHVRRSEASFADARTAPPLTPPGGIVALRWEDRTTTPGVPTYYVVEAESLDFPDCGTGPAVRGSTAVLELGPATDDADLDGPAGTVGNTLRAVGHGIDTVSFEWPLAPPPAPGEEWVVLRSDDRPDTGFVLQARVPAPAWTDPAAPPRFRPTHVWYYDIRLADACLNVSSD